MTSISWGYWGAIAAWGFGAILWVEVVRDLYHALAHVWTPLGRLHNWHHRVFRPDLTPNSALIYRQAQWYNDVPEACVMIALSVPFWGLAQIITPALAWGCVLGSLYAAVFLLAAMARGMGWNWAHQVSDMTHLPGPFLNPPSRWWVNRPYHWRHHFENQNAYFCSTLTLVDQVMGTALSLKGKTIAVTGASGTLGQALLQQLQAQGAKVVALTSRDQPIYLDNADDPIPTLQWQVGQEAALQQELQGIDILIINHGVNVHGDRSPEAIEQSYQVNAFSALRLMEQFLKTVESDRDRVRKELWVNTSEAEVNPAFSPLYELSKRTLGDFVTLRRLDSPCIIRKLILGPFKSNLNPVGVMSGDRVAAKIVKLAQRDVRNIIVTINPVTWVLHPPKELMVSLYFRWLTRPYPVEETCANQDVSNRSSDPSSPPQ
ncbi:bifunctional sterol desaturase/short chain dehydrogenase [Sodalinema gerasimenkoae]|uniref:bifunctional sterol desaturase/short chain dehydrogenase n=1 Tax=Sodalinema gerasimenkoae TaxID=2862348 RepID=UPI0013589484|nr:bifunctional sterol desaturase/short chain dehydrogenase [Sodalinema gerasimenkoae]